MSLKVASSLKRKVVNVWVVVYDGDSSLSYAFGDYNKAMASIESSIRGYLGEEDDTVELLCRKVMAAIRSKPNKACIPIRVNELYIMLYKWELDDKHPVHQVLCECYDAVPPPLKAKIASLFFDSRC